MKNSFEVSMDFFRKIQHADLKNLHSIEIARYIYYGRQAEAPEGAAQSYVEKFFYWKKFRFNR